MPKTRTIAIEVATQAAFAMLVGVGTSVLLAGVTLLLAGSASP